MSRRVPSAGWCPYCGEELCEDVCENCGPRDERLYAEWQAERRARKLARPRKMREQDEGKHQLPGREQ